MHKRKKNSLLIKLKKHSKNHLVPHKKNNYYPLLLKNPILIVLLIVLSITQVFFAVLSPSKPDVLGYATNINSSTVVSLMNQNRTQSGLAAYSTSGQLASAAANKAADMFAHGYWAHTSPTGVTPWYFISQSGYAYSVAGENLAKDFSTSSAVVAAWMASSGHRANILDSRFSQVGVAAVNGTFQGKQTTIVVAMFASPAGGGSAASSANTTAKPKTVASSSSVATQPAAQPAAQPQVSLPKTFVISSPPDSSERNKQLAYTGQVLNTTTQKSASPILTASIVNPWVAFLSSTFLTKLIVGALLILVGIGVWSAVLHSRKKISLKLHKHPMFQAVLISLLIVLLLVIDYGAIV